jgi:hypothetical protein
MGPGYNDLLLMTGNEAGESRGGLPYVPTWTSILALLLAPTEARVFCLFAFVFL